MAENINNIVNEAEGRPIHPMLMVWEVLRKLWAVILLAAIAASCTYVVCSEMYEPQYQTKTTFVASVRDGATSVYSNLTAAKGLAGSFSQILDSDVMRKYVAQEMGTDSVNGEIKAQVIKETNLLEMKVTAGSPREVYLITKAVLNNYEALAETVLNNITVSVLQTPTVPSAPINSSNAEKYAKSAALITAAIVVAWLCIRVYLRDTVKSEDEVEQKLDTKLLAAVYHERKRKSFKELFDRKKRSILVTNPTTGFAFVETYKKLRTRIEYHMRKNGKKTIMVTSVNENEGKSTVAANIALAMNHRGRVVLLIDADMKKPAIHKILGYQDKQYGTINELITGKAELNEVLINDMELELGLILGKKGTSKSTELVGGDEMRKLIEQANAHVDVIIIDTPPMAACADAEMLAGVADATVLVVRQDQAPARIINDAIDSLRAAGTDVIGCVFNNVRAADLSDNYSYGSGGKHGYNHYGYGNYSKYGRDKYGYGSRRKREDNETEENKK